MSIKKYESVDLKHFNESKAFIDYSNDVIDIFENIYEYNSKKKNRKIYIVFDDMIVDILTNKTTSTDNNRTVYQMQKKKKKNEYCSCSVLFCCAKKY